MNADRDLAALLADADVASPPPPGACPTAASLRAASRSRTRAFATVVAVAALVLAVPAIAPRRDAGTPADLRAEVRALRADLARLERALQRALPSPLAIAAERAAADAAQLRYELADARATALLAANASQENR